MRKEAKAEKAVTIRTVDGYHQSDGVHTNYAYAGFAASKYYTSDRTIPLTQTCQRADGKPIKGYGLEIETECTRITDSVILAEVLHKIVFARFPADLFKLQRDGSLGGQSSAECITQVMTREFVRNNYANFKLMFNTYFPAFGISAGGSRCGMHVNISNACFGAAKETQDEAIRKLYYIVNRHFALCKSLFRRTGSTIYCGQMHYMDARGMDLSAFRSDHYVCFNLGHYAEGRVELRLVAGQKDYAAFRNTMECVFFLVDRCKSITWAGCDDLVKIFDGCNRYVFDRLTLCARELAISANELDAIRPTVKDVEYI